MVIEVREHHRVRLPNGKTRPAALLKAGGLTLIERAIRAAQRTGTRDVRILIENRQREVESYLRKRRWPVSPLSVTSLPAAKSDAVTISSNTLVIDLKDSRFFEVSSASQLTKAEDLLYEHFSQKKTDARFALLMRTYPARYLTKLLMRTPLSANTISVLGLITGIASGLTFAVGGYWFSLLGAVLFFLSCVLDYCDGPIARMKFQESDRGCWLDSVCDVSSYLSVFTGMTIGLYRFTDDLFFLKLGGATLFGLVLSFLAMSAQRKAIAGDRPGEYNFRVFSKLREKGTNPFYFSIRKIQFIARRSALPFFVLIFALVNLTSVLLFGAAVGTNTVWILTLCVGRLFRSGLA